MFITFEGPDGSGKSTLARMVADIMPATYLPSIPDFMNSSRELADSLSSSDRFLFYHTCNSMRSRKIGKMLTETQSVVLDRYFHTTATYHQITLNVSLEGYLKHCLEPLNYTQPDALVFVNASPDIRRARLGKRRPNMWDEISFDNRIVEGYLEFLELAACPVISIDTTDMDPTRSAEVIFTGLNKIRPGLKMRLEID
ncbi:hypothetical protein [Nocardia beijingensis]